MNVEIERSLELPNKSFLLLGPRGTGKSTLLKMKVRPALEINLLKSSQYLPLQQNPSVLQEWTSHLKKGDWVVIDEVQKIPALLDEVHAIYEDKKLNFALTGSSARKLKRGNANLLAGRALQVYLFPLTWLELKDQFSLEAVLEWGSLPAVVTDPKNRKETLATYVETYLKQELVEEGIIRKLDPFVRFLGVAGKYNAQVLNVENIARESHLKRTTVDSYFEILEETLIASRLPALSLGLQTKEVRHPKFYYFDAGVARASAGLLFDATDSISKGYALETFILSELRAYNSYFKKERNIFYYKVVNGIEVDFVIETAKKTLSRSASYLAIEVKLGSQWDRRWSKALAGLVSNKQSKVKRGIGVYGGSRRFSQDGIDVFPVQDFLKDINAGKFF